METFQLAPCDDVIVTCAGIERTDYPIETRYKIDHNLIVAVITIPIVAIMGPTMTD